MAKKTNIEIVVSLGDDGAIVSSFENQHLMKRIFVASHESGDFKDLVRANPTAKIYLLLDVIDQNYHFTGIPKVGRSNVNKIIKRKLKNEFDKGDLNSTIFLNEEKKGPKTLLNYLFVSVRNSSPFSDWVECINELPNKFKGVYLLPVESENFIKQIRTEVSKTSTSSEEKEWEIFISFNRVGGFRQIVLRNGKLIFTRISQSLSLQTPDSIGENISQEASNTLEYIRRIGYYDQPLSVYVICSTEAENFIDVAGVNKEDLHVFSPFDLAQKIGLESTAQETDKFGDVIFSGSFIKEKKKVLRLMLPSMSEITRLENFKASLDMLSKFFVVVLPILAIYFAYSAITSISEIVDDQSILNAKKAELLNIKDFEDEYGLNPQRLDEIVRADEVLDLDEDYFKSIMERYRKIDEVSIAIDQLSMDQTNSKDSPKGVSFSALFDFTDASSYSDVLYYFDQYVANLKNEFQDMNVEVFGTPEEQKTINFSSGDPNDSGGYIYNIKVTINEQKEENRR